MESAIAQKATVIVSDVASETELSSSEFNPIIEIINRTRNSIKNQVLTYLMTIYSEQLTEISVFSSSRECFEKRKMCLDNDLASKIERINRVFGEFQIVSPLVVIYGSKDYANYAICTYGKADWYKNAFWIHENSIKELMQNLPQILPVHDDVKEYFEMLKNIKRLASMSDEKRTV